jgi:DNA-binding transcriptional ArsR family regulator
MKKNARTSASKTSGSASGAKARRSPPPAANPTVVGLAMHGSARTSDTPGARWTFLTNHSHVLILISRNPSAVLRQVAIQVGITERAVQRIIADLEEAGILEREKVGRQNHYRIIADQSLRHSVEAHRTIADLLSLMDVEAG